jgi:hypothetical protein
MAISEPDCAAYQIALAEKRKANSKGRLMRTTIKALLLATALTFFGPVIGHAATTCTTSTDKQFYAAAAEYNPRILVASDKALKVFLKVVNEARVANNDAPFVADKFVIGIFQKEGSTVIGTVLFKDHCTVTSSVKVFPVDQFISFLESIGLGVEDFTLQSGA